MKRKTGDSLSVAEYQAQLPEIAKRGKYRNVKTKVDGVTFDSKKEAARWGELKVLERHGTITDLERQVRFDFNYGGEAFASYVADFTYWEGEEFIVEDVKSVITKSNPMYRLKKRAMKLWYDIEILET